MSTEKSVENEKAKLAKGFGIFLVVMLIISFCFGWVFNTKTIVAGFPLFALFSIIIIPTISIIGMAIYVAAMNKKPESGGA